MGVEDQGREQPRPPLEGRATPFFVLAHALGGAASFGMAHLLRFDFDIPEDRLVPMAAMAGPVIAIKLVSLLAFGAYRIVWRYIDFADVRRLAFANVIAAAFMALVDAMIDPHYNIPRVVLVIDLILMTGWVVGSYLGPRYVAELRMKRQARRIAEVPVIIVGAGDAGELLMNEVRRTQRVGLRVVRFLDDHRDKIGREIHGVPVDGPIAEAAERAAQEGVNRAIIAIPSASPVRLRQLADILLKRGFAIQTLPPIDSLKNTASLLGRLKMLDVEDLLRREPVKRDPALVHRTFSEKVVLVTGAAGSIGSELCRQLLHFDPARLVAVDRAESPLVDLERELTGRHPTSRVGFALADVNDAARMRAIFEEWRPAIVFHAAAVKHVPVAEVHPVEAVRVNTLGTRLVMDTARACGVEKFVLISTDKAVRPANVMGATKRLAEMVAQSRGGIAVRFGNVLGSNGSVVNVFKEQIVRGGPVTVTHPDMRRYFMTIPEAVHLVLEAATLGKGGEIFILDMGQPVKIVDLAKDIIRLAGRQPDVDIQIEFTGLRPGEKLFEELSLDEEQVQQTEHPQIVVAKAPAPSRALVEKLVERLEALVQQAAEAEKFVHVLQELVPEYNPQTGKMQAEMVRAPSGEAGRAL